MTPASQTREPAEKNAVLIAKRRFKIRITILALSIVLAHAFVALALHYTYMDDNDHFHTSYLSFFAAFLCLVIFGVCVGYRDNTFGTTE